MPWMQPWEEKMVCAHGKAEVRDAEVEESVESFQARNEKCGCEMREGEKKGVTK